MGVAFIGAKLGLLTTRDAKASHNFSDVPDSAFYHNFVQFLVDNGITAGCAAGQLGGEAPVTRGQTAVFLKKLFDLVDQRVDEIEENLGVIVRTRPSGVTFGVSLTTIMTASDIPAGSYVAIYRGDVVNFGTTTTSEAFMRCQIAT